MMQTNPNAKTNQQGFTLIELSIVLVIIGLIVGGVLVGQDLIKGAEIRALISQIEKYDAAANTFRGKYNGIPGDILNQDNFFTAVTGESSSVAGLGNGDGAVQSTDDGTSSCGTFNCVSGEATMFWSQLSQAGLINESITSTNPTAVTTVVSNSIVPAAKGGSGSISVNANGSANFYVIAAISGTAVGGVPPTINDALEQIEAFQIDTKMDDGIPGVGRVLSTTSNIAGTYNANTDCATGTGSTSTYYTASTQAAQCQLSIRTSF